MFLGCCWEGGMNWLESRFVCFYTDLLRCYDFLTLKCFVWGKVGEVV